VLVKATTTLTQEQIPFGIELFDGFSVGETIILDELDLRLADVDSPKVTVQEEENVSYDLIPVHTVREHRMVFLIIHMTGTSRNGPTDLVATLVLIVFIQGTAFLAGAETRDFAIRDMRIIALSL
jgi:hypothetical protein